MVQFTLEESTKVLQGMSTEEFKNEFHTLLKIRCPIFYTSVVDEKHFLNFLEHFCRVNGYECKIWDAYNGLSDIFTHESEAAADDVKDPITILDHIITNSKQFVNKRDSVDEKRKNGIKGIIFVLLDYFRFLDDDTGGVQIERRIKTIADLNGIVSTIITGPMYKATSVTENIIPNINFPMANKQEIKLALYEVVKGVEDKITGLKKETSKMEEDLINAVSGLTLTESQSAFSKSVVSSKKWDIPLILREKKQIVSKNGLLEFYDQNISMEDVGGLKKLVKWIKERRKCFSQEAEDYGLKKPRGLLAIGAPGAGKSLICKAISNEWSMPLLKLDFGKLFGSLVGDSEKNARQAILVAESVAPSILWIDEVEKAISGINSSSQSDGGTTSRVLSTFLTWMNEKTSPVFVVATANNHESIPPEFLRPGRFDEIFYVDLPNSNERQEIFSIHLKKRKLDPKKFSLEYLADNSDGYSGAEIEKAIDNAMLIGFSEDKRKINTDDVLFAIKQFIPLSTMRAEDFEAIREWSKKRCVKANEEPKGIVAIGGIGSKDLDV